MKPSGISERILSVSLGFLMDWEEGNVTLDDCLDTLREENRPERSAVSSLLFEYFRHKGFIDGLIARHAKKGAVHREMRLLLCCAATQLFFQSGIARESAVNIAVDLAKQRNVHAGGFVNAMLREILRDPETKEKTIPSSFPALLTDRWTRQFGTETADGMIRQFASNPPIAFRVRKDLPTDRLSAFSPLEGMDFTRSFRFYESPDPELLFQSGLLNDASVYIQDPATAMPLSLFDEPPVGRILDACAAPGGKTVMLADLTDSSKVMLVASDRSQRRVLLLNRNLRRAGIRCRTIVSDACEMPFSPASFDCILADVPCSNTGVIRRRPDAPWRFSRKKLDELVPLQARILDSLARLVKFDGSLLYSTCSLEEEEDRLGVDAFLASHPDFILVRDRLLLPDDHHDGAYAALLRRRSAD